MITITNQGDRHMSKDVRGLSMEKLREAFAFPASHQLTLTAFSLTAYAALEVMMHRGWGVRLLLTLLSTESKEILPRWHVLGISEPQGWPFKIGWSDPFTALVEADKWYKENVEQKQ